MGFTITDLINAFKGDIAIIFSDFKMEDHAVPDLPGVNTKRPGGDFLLNLTIGDKTAFDKVMTGLVNKNILSKNGDQYQLGFFGGNDFVIEATNNNLFIASNDALVKAYQAGNNNCYHYPLPGTTLALQLLPVCREGSVAPLWFLMLPQRK